MSRSLFVRSFPLEDISIRSGGDGRTVEAYAAVWDTPAAVRDHQGTYMEQITRTAFNKTIAERGLNFGVFYNHGRTLAGTPSDRGSMPLGKPLEIRADEKGLVTVTRYNNNPLADEVLESIRNGDINGQSFGGSFLQTSPRVPLRGFRADAKGELPLVTRSEVALREYGPTPFPTYASAALIGVRSLADSLTGLDAQEREELMEFLRTTHEEPVRADTSSEAVDSDEPPAAAEHSVRDINLNALRWKARQEGGPLS